MDEADQYKAEVRVCGWLDFKRVVPGIKFPQIPAGTQLMTDFVRWMHENGIHSFVRAGMSGPSMLHQGYSLEDISKIEQWLEAHGVSTQYMVKTPVEQGWEWDKNGKWIDHDPLNPCRVPPGYVMLKLDNPVQVGDIYWHPGWTMWLAVTEAAETVSEMGMPVARKDEASSNS